MKQQIVSIIPKVLFLFLFLTINSVYSQTNLTEMSIPICFTFDGSCYLNSTGGQTKTGCEAWLTMLNTGEYIYASRCDETRLEELDLHVKQAMNFNKKLSPLRRISLSENNIMIDYEDLKTQALFGLTSNKSYGYIIMNEKKEFVYYRVEAVLPQLEELDFHIGKLLKANKKIKADLRIMIEKEKLNIVENMTDGTQMLIGKTDNGKTVAVVLNSKGKFLGYILRDD